MFKRRVKNRTAGKKWKSFLAVFILTVSAFPLLMRAASKETSPDAWRINDRSFSLKDLSFSSLSSPSIYLAGVFDTTRSFLKNAVQKVFPSNATPALNGQAIREKNLLSSVSLATGGGTTVVSINAPSTFEEEVVIRGLLRGTNIDLGAGVITASNILYEIVPGDGIAIEGDRQRPIIYHTFWALRGKTIVTSDPSFSLEVGGGLALGTTTASSTKLTFNAPALVEFTGGAKTILPENKADALSIGSATGTPLVSVSTVSGGSVAVGSAATSSAKFSVTNDSTSQLKNILEILTASCLKVLVVDKAGNIGVGTATPSSPFSVVGSSTFTGPLTAENDVSLAASSGKVGIGTKSPSDLLTVRGTMSVSGDASFSTSLLLTSVTGCTGSQVLETDGSGRIICGVDEDRVGGNRGTVAGSGASGRVAVWTTSQDIGTDDGIFWSDEGTLGIG